MISLRVRLIAGSLGLALAGACPTAPAWALPTGCPLDPATVKAAGPLRLEHLEIRTASGQVRRFKVQMADNNATREIGLMCRKHMARDAGMLFDFKTPQQVSFWMKNTVLPLDIIFIGADGRIVSIARQAKPFDETPLPADGVTALGVLEINGGEADQLGIREGDLVHEKMFRRSSEDAR